MPHTKKSLYPSSTSLVLMYYSPRFLTLLQHSRIIPVLSLDSVDLVDPIFDLLRRAGLLCAEITFRTTMAASAFQRARSIARDFFLGAGTIRSLDQFQYAHDYGADFIVSPGLNPQIAQAAMAANVTYIPGIDSTLGIEQAFDLGCRILKFFPAHILGGPKWLQAIAAPYPDLLFIPTGGVSLENMATYVALPNVLAIGGSFVVPLNLVKEKDFFQISTLLQKALEIAHAAPLPAVTITHSG